MLGEEMIDEASRKLAMVTVAKGRAADCPGDSRLIRDPVTQERTTLDLRVRPRLHRGDA
jgi:hypothetical protein